MNLLNLHPVEAVTPATQFISQWTPTLATGLVHISHAEWVLCCASSHSYWLSSATPSSVKLQCSGNLKYSLTAAFNAGEKLFKANQKAKKTIQHWWIFFFSKLCVFYHRLEIQLPFKNVNKWIYESQRHKRTVPYGQVLTASMQKVTVIIHKGVCPNVIWKLKGNI